MDNRETLKKRFLSSRCTPYITPAAAPKDDKATALCLAAHLEIGRSPVCTPRVVSVSGRFRLSSFHWPVIVGRNINASTLRTYESTRKGGKIIKLQLHRVLGLTQGKGQPQKQHGPWRTCTSTLRAVCLSCIALPEGKRAIGRSFSFFSWAGSTDRHGDSTRDHPSTNFARRTLAVAAAVLHERQTDLLDEGSPNYTIRSLTDHGGISSGLDTDKNIAHAFPSAALALQRSYRYDTDQEESIHRHVAVPHGITFIHHPMA